MIMFLLNILLNDVSLTFPSTRTDCIGSVTHGFAFVSLHKNVSRMIKSDPCWRLFLG